MPKYSVTLMKPVKDVLRADVEVEADTPEEAENKAIEIAGEQDLYAFYACGDCTDPIEAEVTLLDPKEG